MSRYSSSLGSWQEGDTLDVPDAVGDALRRDSPGSFLEVVETATDLAVPDRRARGGRKRRSAGSG